MCHRNWRRREERFEEERGEGLWDLFYRETGRSEPPMPIAEREEEPSSEPERDEVPTGVER
jgi:hypothetical protein